LGHNYEEKRRRYHGINPIIQTVHPADNRGREELTEERLEKRRGKKLQNRYSKEIDQGHLPSTLAVRGVRGRMFWEE